MARRFAAALVSACVLLGAWAAHAQADETRRSTLQLAAIHGLTHTDKGNHVLLERGTVRLRAYPGTATMLVSGRQFRVKDRFEREGGRVMVSPRVQRFMARQLREARTVVLTTPARTTSRTGARPPLEPLPPRMTRVKREPRKTRTTPQPKPAPKPRTTARADRGWIPGVDERPWKWIVIHHSDDRSGNMAKYDRIHREENGWENGCGYHFVVGNGSLSGDGQIEIGPRWKAQLQGAHAKVPGNRFNEKGIGICLVGDFDEGGRRPTPAQMEELVRLIRWLQARYRVQDADLRGHCDCCTTQCPGRFFPWDELRQRLR
ncbi:MAG: peptidoglycan recognition family protein [Planctomycetota bacterium]|nr:peptidoglycan recognition family protein [Planctomycetota bacterium]